MSSVNFKKESLFGKDIYKSTVTAEKTPVNLLLQMFFYLAKKSQSRIKCILFDGISVEWAEVVVNEF